MFVKLLRQYRDQRLALTVIAVLSVATAASEALALVSIAPLVELAAEGESTYSGSIGPVELSLTLRQLAVVAAGLLLLNLMLTLFAAYVTSRVMTGFRLRSRLAVIRAFEDAEWSVQAKEREGWLLTLSTRNVDQAAQGLMLFGNWLRAAMGLLVFVSGALIVSFGSVFVILVVLGGVLAALRPINKYARRVSAEMARRSVALNEELSSLTTNTRELKVFGVTGAAGAEFREGARQERRFAQKSEMVKKLTSPLFRTAGSLLIVGLIAVAASDSASEVAAVGLVALLLYRGFNYGTSLVSVHQSLVHVTPWIDQLDEGVDKLRAGAARVGTVDPGAITGVRVDQVTFRYPGASSDALSDVSVHLAVGEVLGIVGPSGAGKSTLAELFLGLREPDRGAVRLNDTPMVDVVPEVRSRALALLSQTVPVLPRSLRENIRFFRDIDDECVSEALAMAGLEDFVESLPDGLDTDIGPGSRAVSGGQAQRIGMARALAGKPAIIVLDEPTSSLDAATEHAVTETIGRLRGSTGVVIIAHRLTTLRHCDRVAVLERGKLVDLGAPEDVRARSNYLQHAYELGQLDWAADSSRA